MEAVVFGLVLAAGAAAATWWTTRGTPDTVPGTDAGGEDAEAPHALERDSTVVLDIEPEDVADERVQRLVRAAAAQVFATEARVLSVTVTNRAGVVLGRVPRTPPRLRDVPDVAVPHAEGSRGHTPSVVPHEPPPLPPLDPDGIASEPVHRDLAETFDLSPAVTEHVTDRRDPVAILDAILRAGGHDPQRREDTVRVGDTVFLVLDGHGHPLRSDDLSRTFLRFTETGLPHGYAVVLGFADRAELRRRQQLAPQLTYVGRDAIQRMADAVAVGADPLAFVTQPQVEVTRP